MCKSVQQRIGAVARTRVIYLRLLVALLCIGSSWLCPAENVSFETTYRLRIDPTLSTLQLKHDGVIPVPEPGSLIPFGGVLDVLVRTRIIDTLASGAPRAPVDLSTVQLHFIALDLPDSVTDFEPGEPFDRFYLDGEQIPGTIPHVCASAWAMGISCSGQTVYFGTPEELTGTFDGVTLNIVGSQPHNFFEPYYEYAISASAIPVPASFLLLASGLLCTRRWRLVAPTR